MLISKYLAINRNVTLHKSSVIKKKVGGASVVEAQYQMLRVL
jgi:hypothetical protein